MSYIANTKDIIGRIIRRRTTLHEGAGCTCSCVCAPSDVAIQHSIFFLLTWDIIDHGFSAMANPYAILQKDNLL